MILPAKLKNIIDNRFALWLSKRIPAQHAHRLTQKNLFIFPTAFGFSYLTIVFLLFLLGTNYQNNLILLFSFFLTSLFITSILHTFSNLAGMKIKENNKEVNGFAGQTVKLTFSVDSHNPKHAVRFYFTPKFTTHIDKIVPAETQTIAVELVCEQRGEFYLPRLVVESYHALGLFRCWSRLQFNTKVLVYPKPLKPHKIYENAITNNNDESNKSRLSTGKIQGDDFQQLKAFVVGESLAKVSWQHLAKQQGWWVKDLQQQKQQNCIYSLASVPVGNIETRLSQLTHLLLIAAQSEQRFGLQLNHYYSGIDQSKAHLKSCLTALARYQHD